MDKKIVAIELTDNLYFIVNHINSKYYNDFSNNIIDIYQLSNEIMGYAYNNTIYLKDIIEIRDIENNIIEYDILYNKLNSIIIANKLSSVNINFILYNYS